MQNPRASHEVSTMSLLLKHVILPSVAPATFVALCFTRVHVFGWAYGG